MDMPGLSDFEDTGPVATFSYLDTSSMLLSGPFCCHCMNLKKWKIVQLNTSGNLILYLHKIGENVRCEMWKLQLRNDSERPFTFVTTVDGLSFLPCSELNCLSNKPKKSAQNALVFSDDALKLFESVERQRIIAILEKLQTLGEKSEQKVPLIDKEIQKHPLEKTAGLEMFNGTQQSFSEVSAVRKTSKTQSLESVATYLKVEAAPVAPPFFYPSVGVKKPLDITDDLHKKFAEISNSKEFPIFVKLLGVKFAEFCLKVNNERPLKRCNVCEKSFNTWFTLVLHMLSRRHIDQMTDSGHYFDVKDYELISGIFKEANTNVSKEKLASGDVTGSGSEAKSPSIDSDVKCGELSLEVAEIQNNTSNSNAIEAASTVASAPKCKWSTEVQAKLASVPLMFGSLKEHNRLSEAEIAYLVAGVRKVLLQADRNLKMEICRQNMWKVKMCVFCPEATKATTEYFEHVLSVNHLDRMMRQGVFPFKADFDYIAEIISNAVTASPKPKTISNSGLPFLCGTLDDTARFSEARLPSALRILRKKLAALSPSDVETFLQRDCNRPKGNKCLKCDDKVNWTEWFDHVLSQEHIDNLTKSGRFVSYWDVTRMHYILRQIKDAEKQAALFKDDSEEPDVESEQKASPTNTKKHSWRSRGTRGTRPRARAVKG